MHTLPISAATIKYLLSKMFLIQNIEFNLCCCPMESMCQSTFNELKRILLIQRIDF
jgi:hypothetical protein